MPAALRLEEHGYLTPVPQVGTKDKDADGKEFTWDEDRRLAQSKLNLTLEIDTPEEDSENVQTYQSELVQVMVKSWSLGDVTEDAILDLPKASFEKLAAECDSAFRGGDQVDMLHPKVVTVALPG